MGRHFSDQELERRRGALSGALQQAGLEGLLLFRQESMYYLTGYDSFGYVHFQVMVWPRTGDPVLLTRAPDRLQARFTSNVRDVRIWVDGEDADPYRALADLLRGLGLAGRRLGAELEAYGLTAARGFALVRALEGVCELEDASFMVSRLRLVKTEEELVYVRQAAALADAAWSEAQRLAAPGAFEGDILAAMQGAVLRGGGDDPANETIIGSGPGALMCRYYTGRRHLDSQDQLTLEFAGVYRHYHACAMRTVLIGAPRPLQVAMFEPVRDALLAAREALRPGRAIGEVFDAHARVLDAAGMGEHRLNACGYSLGATFAPSWMDWPMLFHGNPQVAAPGMVFFIHIIVFDAAKGLAMTLGQAVEVTESGMRSLSQAPLELAIAQ